MTVQYATYFDRHYLSRGLALVESLATQAPGAPVWVLCLDDETARILRRLAIPNLAVVPLVELEAREPELLRVRPTRSHAEYYFTLTAPFLLDVMLRAANLTRLVYVDADHYFFGPPSPLTEPLDRASIVLTDHHYPPSLADKYVYGRYNVGLLAFRRDEAALRCLRWWRERCIEWCFDRLEGDRYGDQKYLDAWPELFPGVHVLDHKGVGVALWNAQNFCFERVSGGPADGTVTVDGEPLVAFHFSSFRILWDWLFDTGSRMYGYRLDPVMRNDVYVPYARAIRRAVRRISAAGGQVQANDSLRGVRAGKLPGTVGVAAAKARVLLAGARRQSLLVVTEPLGR
jgi:hypothetical protein